MRELYGDLIAYLSRPGKLSKTCWREVYEVRDYLVDRVHGDLALCRMIEVASKTARARRERLPDGLHNMMILNSGGVKPILPDRLEWWSEGRRTETERHVREYVVMLGRLPAQKARA